MLKFHTRLISCLHCQKICSKYPPLTGIRARRCVRYSSSFLSRTVLSIEPATLFDFCSRQHHSSNEQIKQPRYQPSGLHYLWHHPIVCLPVTCVQNVNELKQRLLDVRYSMEQLGIFDSEINQWRMSLQVCLRLKKDSLRKMLQQRQQLVHLCETFIC